MPLLGKENIKKGEMFDVIKKKSHIMCDSLAKLWRIRFTFCLVFHLFYATATNTVFFRFNGKLDV